MLVLAALALPLGAATGGAAAPHVAATPRPALPDSVLARVGDRRLVTVSEFRRAWEELQPPARPDSLTPQGAREFLQLLVGKEVLAEAAGRETWVWTRPESARYFSTLDHLTLQAALERPLAETRAAMARPGEPDPDPEIVGIACRERAIDRLGVSFDTLALGHFARAFAALPPPPSDSGIFAALRARSRLPEVNPDDSALVVAHTRAGDYTGRDLLRWWSVLNPLARPHVETTADMRDIAKNGIFERELRATAAAQGLARRPDIAAELARMRELFAVTHLVEREVYRTLAMDSVTLRRYYDQDPGAYAVPTRLRVLKLDLDTRDDATRMALRLRDPVEAESLEAKSGRQRLGYAVEISAESDSTLYARGFGAGVGAVLGPDSTAEGWAVMRVLAVLPAHTRSFDEARTLVEHRWYGIEGERRMVDLLARLRRRTHITLNARALAKLPGS